MRHTHTHTHTSAFHVFQHLSVFSATFRDSTDCHQLDSTWIIFCFFASWYVLITFGLVKSFFLLCFLKLLCFWGEEIEFLLLALRALQPWPSPGRGLGTLLPLRQGPSGDGRVDHPGGPSGWRSRWHRQTRHIYSLRKYETRADTIWDLHLQKTIKELDGIVLFESVCICVWFFGGVCS